MKTAITDRFERMPTTAQEWVARMQSRPLTTAESDAFNSWLESDPEAREEYRRCEQVGRLGDRLRAAPDLVVSMPAYSMIQAPRSAQISRWGWIVGAGVSTASLAFVLAITLPGISPKPPETHATARGEQRSVSLEDGSTMHLNTDSVVRVTFSDQDRRVELASGEAFFDVTKDAVDRPFIVNAATTEVRVLGTKFSVRTANGRTEVRVAEGKVEVRPDTTRTIASIPGKVELVPGNALRIDRQAQLVNVVAIIPERVASWRTGTIDFDNATLEEVIGEVNRYSATPFVIADVRIKGVRLSGTFKVGNIEAVRFALKDGFRINSSAEPDRILLKYGD